MTPGLLHLLVAISTASANALATGIWQGALLTVCILLCLRLLPRISAASRFAIWASAFLILALLPVLHWPHAALGQLASAGAPRFHLDIRWSFAIAGAWGILSFVRLARLAANAVRLRAIWRDAAPIASPIETGITTGSRPVQVYTSTEVDRPSVIGFFSPRILIPTWLIDKLGTDELQQIILHEREHLRRADDWLNLLQKIALAVFPLNPVLLWIEKRLCFERELACDDGVLLATRAPLAYASCLTNLAERALDRRATSLSLGAWERRPALARRVFRILLGEKSASPTLSRGLSAGLVSALLLGAVGLSRSPELIAFSSPAAPPTAAETASHTHTLPATTYGAGLQNVSFEDNSSHPAKMTNASLVSYRSATPDRRSVHKEASRTAVTSPRRVKARHRHDIAAHPRQWMVLTSWDRSYSSWDQSYRDQSYWDESYYPAVVLAIMTYSPGDTTNAYTPADSGWLLFQL